MKIHVGKHTNLGCLGGMPQYFTDSFTLLLVHSQVPENAQVFAVSDAFIGVIQSYCTCQDEP